MHFSIQLPTDRVDAPDDFLSAAAIAEMARCAEEGGFAAAFVTDHPMPDERWLRAGGHHALDPFVALSFAAAATDVLRLQTHILVLGYRNPFLVAKAAASLDVLSGGRVILGVAGGYLESEFRALGADFEARNEVADAWIPWIRRAWGESALEGDGPGFALSGNSMLPQPLQKPGPPIWVGGNSRRAIRRAVELGDGWLPFPAPPRMAGFIRTAALESSDDLRARLAYAREHAAAIGREAPLDVTFSPLGLERFSRGELEAEALVAEVRELESLGVTWLTVSLPARSRGDWCARVRSFGRQVIAGMGRG